MSIKLATRGVILSNDRDLKPQIQKIDDVVTFEEEHGLECVDALASDKEAVQIVRELVIENYIEKIQQDLLEGDKSLIYALLNNEGLVPISSLNEQELIKEAIELEIF